MTVFQSIETEQALKVLIKRVSSEVTLASGQLDPGLSVIFHDFKDFGFDLVSWGVGVKVVISFNSVKSSNHWDLALGTDLDKQAVGLD